MTESNRSPKSTTRKAAKKGDLGKTFKGFTDEERVAMKEHLQEQKAAARRGRRADKEDEESAVLAKVAAMPESDRARGERLHAIMKGRRPAPPPGAWYGMP